MEFSVNVIQNGKEFSSVMKMAFPDSQENFDHGVYIKYLSQLKKLGATKVDGLKGRFLKRFALSKKHHGTYVVFVNGGCSLVKDHEVFSHVDRGYATRIVAVYKVR